MDLVVIVLDYTYDLRVQLESVEPYLGQLDPSQIITVVNKIDLVAHNNTPYLGISAKKGVGVDALLSYIKKKKIESYIYKEGYVHPMYIHEFYTHETVVFVEERYDVDDLVYIKAYVDDKKKELLNYIHEKPEECVSFS